MMSLKIQLKSLQVKHFNPHLIIKYCKKRLHRSCPYFAEDTEPEDIDFVVQNLNCSTAETDQENVNRRNKSKWKLTRLFRESSQLRKSTSVQSKASSSEISSPQNKKDEIGSGPPPALIAPPTQSPFLTSDSPKKSAQLEESPTSHNKTNPSTSKTSPVSITNAPKISNSQSSNKKNNCMIS